MMYVLPHRSPPDQQTVGMDWPYPQACLPFLMHQWACLHDTPTLSPRPLTGLQVKQDQSHQTRCPAVPTLDRNPPGVNRHLIDTHQELCMLQLVHTILRWPHLSANPPPPHHSHNPPPPPSPLVSSPRPPPSLVLLSAPHKETTPPSSLPRFTLSPIARELTVSRSLTHLKEAFFLRWKTSPSTSQVRETELYIQMYYVCGVLVIPQLKVAHVYMKVVWVMYWQACKSLSIVGYFVVKLIHY